MNSSIRRHGMLNTSSLFLGFLIVLGLYSWLVQLERKLEVLNAVLRHASSTGQEATPMLQVDNDVELLETDFTGSISDLEPLGDERAVQEPLLPDLAASISSTVNEAVQAAGESVDPQSHGDDSGGSIPQPGNVEGSPIRGDSSPDNSTDPNLAALSASEITPSEDLSYDCSAFPGASDVLLVIKTGATEIFSKLPTHLLTTLNCVPDFMVFSDMAQQIGSLEIYDALASISDKWKVEDGTLSTLYPKLKDYHSKGLEVTGLGKEGAWELDKWKNVPMAIGAWKKYPEKKWFVFIDADSAILWSNLLLWLGTQDASQPLYYGSPVYIGQTTFAHGGSGYVLSGAAAKILVDLEPEKKEEWEKRTSEVCCGDQMLAEALNSGGIHIANANPIIQGLTPRSVDYDEWHWCKAPVTFHHLTTAEVEELWRWEQGQLREKVRED